MNKLQIIPDQEDPLFIFLIWDNVVWKKLSKRLYFRKLNSLFRAQSLDELDHLFQEIQWKVAKMFAVNSLGKKAFLVSELVEKMQKNGFSEDVIEKAISFCQTIGSLDDEKILEMRVRKEFRKGRGLKYVKAKWQRSDEEGLIDWNSTETKELEKKAIYQWIQKKGKGKDLFLFLLKRGFRSEIIKEVLNSEIE